MLQILLLAVVAISVLGQYVFIERYVATPHLAARIPTLAAREYPGGVVAKIHLLYEVDTVDFDMMQLDMLDRLSIALENVPLQYLTVSSFEWLTAGSRCVAKTLICKGENGTGEGLLAPGFGGALPNAYIGSLSLADPRYCEAADGAAVPDNPTTVIKMEDLPTKFDPVWDHLDENKDWQLVQLVNSIQLCVNKANTSLMYYPVAIQNVFITGSRDRRNTVVSQGQDSVGTPIDLHLHVVGVIPVTWAKFLNRKFILNGSIPLPMYQPEVVDKDAVVTRDLNVTLPILAVRKMIRHPDLGGDILEVDLPVCEDPKVVAEGCVRMTVDYYLHPSLPEYKLRGYVEWKKDNFTKVASDPPFPFGTFNVSQGPWPVVEWVGETPEQAPGPWAQRKFPQKVASSFREDCKARSSCGPLPPAPPMRHMHSAVLFKTWTFADQAQRYLCNERPECGPDCLTNLTCLGGVNYFQENFYFRSTVFRNDDGGVVPIYTLQSEDCPGNCCRDRRLCLRTHDVLGYEAPYDTEMMLVFGGKGYIHEKDPATGKLIYHSCEHIPKSDLRRDWRSCNEVVLGDLWRYDIVRAKWDFIKPDSAISLTTGQPVGFPYTRYGHGAALVEEVDGNDKYFKRLYMYVYGGLSPQCSGGGVCSDVWKYEIPFASQAYYPKFPDGEWMRGNTWMKLKDNPFGGRYRHAMVVTSGMEYIYVYGGQVIGEFSNMLMRYRISTDLWEDLDPFGRVSLTRLVYDYTGRQVVQELPLSAYNPDIDVDCANAWRFDGKWAHCRVCADCRLKTGTRAKGALFPTERGDTAMVTFPDHTPGAVDDVVAMFGGYRTTWGTLRDPEAECASIVTTTTTTFKEVPMEEGVPLSDSGMPGTTPLLTTTTIPADSGVQYVGDLDWIGPTRAATTTTTTLRWTTTGTTTERLLIETRTSTSTKTVTTRTTTVTRTQTTTYVTGTTTAQLTTQSPRPVVPGTDSTIKNISGGGEYGAPVAEDAVLRVGPEVCTQKYYFDDLWLFEATTNQLFEQEVTGSPPMARRGHGMIARPLRGNQTQLVLFGGHNQDNPYNDMWILNVNRDLKDRTWARIDAYFEGDRPPKMAYHTMIYSQALSSFIVFGGLSWRETDLERSDVLRNIDRRCLKQAQDMVESEAGKAETDFLKMMRRACEDTNFCCEISSYEVPPVYLNGSKIRTDEGLLNLTAISRYCRKQCQQKAFVPQFHPVMAEGLWVFRTNVCMDNCSGHGYCDMSQCICEPGYYGIDCSQRRCPGSPCYMDGETKEQFCADCSGHGRCIDGECQCSPGWGFEDCSVVLCEDNCSSTPAETRGICVEDFPVHQCVCQGRWSGRKCDTLLCLNGCSGRGVCQTNGTCSCEKGFSGEDCSLFTFSMK